MRKHHNRLYFGKYRYKTIFRIPGSVIFYPTTDEHLQDIQIRHKQNKDLYDLAKFIMSYRKIIKFRFQERKLMFYSNQKIAKKLIERFWEFWTGSNVVDPRFTKLEANTVGCSRLPHGKYQYQIFIKKDAHNLVTETQKSNLRDFIERNTDNCLVPGFALLDWLEDRSPYCFGGYFYVTQQQYITPMYMMIAEAIDKIIQYRKVNNGSNKKIKR